jgi:hypothetical protein
MLDESACGSFVDLDSLCENGVCVSMERGGRVVLTLGWVFCVGDFVKILSYSFLENENGLFGYCM